MGTQIISPETSGYRPEIHEKPDDILVQFGDGTTRKFKSRAELIKAMQEENENTDRWN